MSLQTQTSLEFYDSFHETYNGDFLQAVGLVGIWEDLGDRK